MSKVAAFFLLILTVTPSALGYIQETSAPSQLNEALRNNAINPAEQFDDIETFIDGVVSAQMRGLDTPAATVSIVKNGTVIFAKGYGLASIADQRRVNAENTLFRPGSISKLFTWTAVMQQVEAGNLDLNADVNQYLKTFQIPAAYDTPITLKHLLTHTAGFEEGALGYLISENPDSIISLQDALAKYMPRRINKPGAYSSYSNYATALAGLIVENVSGIRFDEYIKQRIFDPLGMTNSSFSEPLPASLIHKMATGYKREAGVFKAQPFEIIASFGPAGSLSSTAVDMAKFMIAHLSDGELEGVRILAPETARQMRTRLFGPDERLSGMAHGFYEKFVNGRRLVGHGGDTILFHSELMLDVEEGLGIFVSYMAAGGGKARSDFIQLFYDHYYPDPLPQIKPPADFAERAAQYAGNYRFWRHNESTLEKAMTGLTGGLSVAPTADNTLLLSGIGEPRQFVEIGDNLFRQVDGHLKIAFGEDEAGNMHDLYLDGLVFMSSSRKPRFETGLYTKMLPVTAFVLFVTVWTGWLYRRREYKMMSRTERTAIYLAMSMSGVQLLFVIVMIVIISVYQASLIFNIPTVFKAALLLPDLASVFAVAVAWCAVQCWRDSFWRKGRRIHYTMVALSGVFMVWFYYYWNFLGIQLA